MYSFKNHLLDLEEIVFSHGAVHSETSFKLMVLSQVWLCNRIMIAYLTPRKVGFSPGAVHSETFFKLMMCARAVTVAATYHGRPSKP